MLTALVQENASGRVWRERRSRASPEQEAGFDGRALRRRQSSLRENVKP